MATLTATTFAQGPRSNVNGVTTRTVQYVASSALEASAQTILLCKIPNKATILEIYENHTTGASSCPVDIGIDSDLSAFASQLTQGANSRMNTNFPYTVSLSDDAAANYATLKATPTLASSTTSFKLNLTVLYTMDK